MSMSWVRTLAHAAQNGLQDGDLQFGNELAGDAPLQDADASKLLRELCGDMYIDASQLDQVVSLAVGVARGLVWLPCNCARSLGCILPESGRCCVVCCSSSVKGSKGPRPR